MHLISLLNPISINHHNINSITAHVPDPNYNFKSSQKKQPLEIRSGMTALEYMNSKRPINALKAKLSSLLSADSPSTELESNNEGEGDAKIENLDIDSLLDNETQSLLQSNLDITQSDITEALKDLATEEALSPFFKSNKSKLQKQAQKSKTKSKKEKQDFNDIKKKYLSKLRDFAWDRSNKRGSSSSSDTENQKRNSNTLPSTINKHPTNKYRSNRNNRDSSTETERPRNIYNRKPFNPDDYLNNDRLKTTSLDEINRNRNNNNYNNTDRTPSYNNTNYNNREYPLPSGTVLSNKPSTYNTNPPLYSPSIYNNSNLPNRTQASGYHFSKHPSSNNTSNNIDHESLSLRNTPNPNKEKEKQSGIEKDLEETESNHRTLLGQQKNTQTSLAENQKELSQNDGDIRLLNNSLSEARREVNRLDNQLKKKKAARSMLKDLISSLKSELQDLGKRIEEVKTRLEGLRDKVKGL